MPRGLRDLIAYGLSYGAQLWAYLLLLTDRYPSSDPLTAIGPLPAREDPVQLKTLDDLRRSRLTVFFRLLLALPHLVWLSLWGVAALLAAIVNWLATLVAGTSPRPLHRFLAAYMRYQLHVTAYLHLIGNPFPGFTGSEESYPIELRIADRARQNRWSVLFRSLLALPALLIASAYGSLVLTVAFLAWFAALINGPDAPRPAQRRRAVPALHGPSLRLRLPRQRRLPLQRSLPGRLARTRVARLEMRAG